MQKKQEFKQVGNPKKGGNQKSRKSKKQEIRNIVGKLNIVGNHNKQEILKSRISKNQENPKKQEIRKKQKIVKSRK